MRLFPGICLVILLSACGGGGDAGRADDATAASSANPSSTTTSTDAAHPSPSVSLDTDLANAAEDLAASLSSGGPDLSDALGAPVIPTGKADATITADPDDYRVEGSPNGCRSIWRAGATLPSPYDGCTDGDLLVAAEGRRGKGGISYTYDGLCAGAGERIRRC